MAFDGIIPPSLKGVENSTAEVTDDPSPQATPAQRLEQELLEVDAAIDEAWELLEPTMRYLADR